MILLFLSAVMSHSMVHEGVEIEPGLGCELETWSTQNASPDCLTECKKRMPPCIAYSYNKNTTKCTTVTACDLLLFKNSSKAITYYSSMIPFLVLFLNSFFTLLFVQLLVDIANIELK